VLIESLGFTPDFDLASFADQFSTTGNTPSQPGFADTVRLALSVQSQSLNAVSPQISIAGTAALQVGGTAAEPVITGRTTLTSGEMFFRNVRYALQRGIITFDDPNQTHPVLNVTVSTIIEQYNLTLTLRGPLDKLTTNYVSDPPLATADIINLVARGKTTQEQAASSQSTDSMIASQVAGQLSNSVQKLAGISSLQIDPTLGGSNSNPSARVAIQQRVSKNLLFSFSTDVSQPGSEIVQGEYQLTKRWSVSVQRDQLGGVSVDGRYHKRF
jgi:translocation and assembly module TamB